MPAQLECGRAKGALMSDTPPAVGKAALGAHAANLGGLGLALYLLMGQIDDLKDQVTALDAKQDTLIVQVVELQAAIGGVAALGARNAGAIQTHLESRDAP